MFNINFIDSSVEETQEGILLTIKLNENEYLKLDFSESQSVYAYYRGKDMISNGIGTLDSVSSDILTIGQGEWVKN